MTQRSDYSEVKEEGDQARVEARALLDYAWLSSHLVQCEPDEQSGIPDYSLNGTKGSSAIQCLPMISSNTWRWPSWSQGPFGLESVLEITVEVQIPPLVYLSLPPTRQDLTQGQWPEGRFIVGVKGGRSASSRDSNTALTMLVTVSLSAMWA